VLRATGTGADSGTAFHGVVPGTGASGTFNTNLTPLSEMVVARIAGATPATFFSSFGSTSTVAASSVTQALDYVRTALAGITDLGTANPLADALVVGNALDLKIDQTMAALAANGVTLAQVSAAIAANPSAPAVVAAPLAPVAPDCSWLKSGRYRIISPYASDPLWRAHVLTVNAAAGTATDQSNATTNLVSSGACRYTSSDDEFNTTTMVSSAGVLVMQSQSIATPSLRTISIGLPEQTLPLSEFTGTWNLAGWDPDSDIPTPGYIANTGEMTFGAGGQITAASDCVGTAACSAGSGPFPSITVNAEGGFNLVEDGVTRGRVFMFKTLAGKSVWVLTSDDGQLVIATRKESLGALPAVGTVNYFREFTLNGTTATTALTENSVTVTSVDAAANSITRSRASDGRVDTFAVDSPRAGLRHRVANTCTIGGNPSNCAEVVQIPLQGMGITLSLSVGLTTPSSAFYAVSVGRPAPVN
jgi:hypothetical protein